jgi:SAM-dependent methyltransferase
MTDSDHESATRAAYDTSAEMYARWVGTEISAATESAIDRSLLAAFVELVAPTAGARVADIGCGSGRVAAYMHTRGLDVTGVDLSPAMLAVARTAHPGIPFEEGRLSALPMADRSLAGAVCWYSIIHTPPDHLDDVCVELARVLAPGGHLLVAFQAGTGERVDRTEAYGKPVSLTSYHHDPDYVARRLTDAGLQVRSQTRREPEFTHEKTPQAFLTATADAPHPEETARTATGRDRSRNPVESQAWR